MELLSPESTCSPLKGMFMSCNPYLLWLHIHHRSPVTANITLLSSADDQAKGSHYNVKAVSWSAPVEVTIPSAPINQTLLMDARTTYSSIQATLPKTFEGLFRVISSSGTSPSVQFRDNVTDPSGMGRHRNTEYFRIKPKEGKGRITWSDDRQDLGFVTLKCDDGSTYLEV